jgi:MFS family permease
MTPEYRRVAYPQYVLFFVLGAAFAAWASRIPAIRDAIGLTPETLTLALIGRGLGTVAAFPLSAWLTGHFGAKRASLFAGTGLLLSVPMLAMAPSWIWLAVTLFFAGAVTSSYDVAINALGSSSEQRTGLTFMSKLHAFFGVGNFTGALAGMLAVNLELSPLVHFSISSAVLFGVLLWNYTLLPDEATQAPANRRFVLPTGGLLVLGLIGFLASMTESQVNSWVTLLFRDQLMASESLAPLGYAAFAGSMLVMRLFGDAAKARFGARPALTAGVAAAAAGLLLASFTGSIVLATVGLLAAGAGLATVFPYLFSAAGREGAGALAAVATMGYSGGILAPPMMGFMVKQGGLDMGFLFLGITAAVMAGVAWKAEKLR